MNFVSDVVLVGVVVWLIVMISDSGNSVLIFVLRSSVVGNVSVFGVVSIISNLMNSDVIVVCSVGW